MDPRPGQAIEIVSPGNKDSTNALRSFVRKAKNLLDRGIHLLVVDLFPPSIRDPHGIHESIWDQVKEEPYGLPADEPLTLAGSETVAYVENVAAGEPLTDMPIFLTPDRYVPCPLEATYRVQWGVFPGALKGPLEAHQTRGRTRELPVTAGPLYGFPGLFIPGFGVVDVVVFGGVGLLAAVAGVVFGGAGLLVIVAGGARQ